MNIRAEGRFDLKWTEEPAYDDAEGAELAHVVITKTFHGDITGSSVTHMTKAMSPREDSAGYVAIERVTGSLHGKSGSFVLQHNAIMDRSEPMLNIVVVPETATGELTGLRGSVVVEITEGRHDYVFDYTLAEVPAV